MQLKFKLISPAFWFAANFFALCAFSGSASAQQCRIVSSRGSYQIQSGTFNDFLHIPDGRAYGIDTVNRKVYFTRSDRIMRMNYDGSKIESVIRNAYPENASAVTYTIAADGRNGKLYWSGSRTSLVTGQIEFFYFRSNLDGTSPEEFFHFESASVASPVFAVNPELEELYFSNRSLLMRRPIAGGTTANLATVTGDIVRIERDAKTGKLFVATLVQPTSAGNSPSYKLYSLARDGSALREIAAGAGEASIALDAGNRQIVMVVSHAPNTADLVRMNLDGGGRAVLSNFPSGPGNSFGNIQIDPLSQRVFFSHFVDQSANITIADWSGNDRHDFFAFAPQLTQLPGALGGVDPIGQHLLIFSQPRSVPGGYFIDLTVANYDGSSPHTVVSDFVAAGVERQFAAVTFDPISQKMFFVIRDSTPLSVLTSYIESVNADGSGRTPLRSVPYRVDHLEVDGVHQKLYWAGINQFHRSNLDGTSVETLPSGGSSSDFVIDWVAQKLYYATINLSSQLVIRRGNLDGTNFQTIHTEWDTTPPGSASHQTRTIFQAILDKGSNSLYVTVGNLAYRLNLDTLEFTSDYRLAGGYSFYFLDDHNATFSIQGKVSDHGVGLPGVSVDGGDLGTQLTDSNGNYVFSNVPSCTLFKLTPRLADYVFSSSSVQGEVTSNRTIDFSASLLDTDGDGIPDSTDTDDDNDGLSDAQEISLGFDPRKADTDRDGVSDAQELTDGTDALDSGSTIRTLPLTVCAEWNGFLGGMFNVMEHTNMTGSAVNVVSSLYSQQGESQSSVTFPLAAGAQFDLLAHTMSGWQLNSYGNVCSRIVGGSPGDLDGRMIYYKPKTTWGDFEFAVALPFTSGRKGEQFVTFNTYQPGTNPDDQGDLVANWVQVNNLSNEWQSGTLSFYRQDGVVFGWEDVNLAPNGRADISAHRFGTNRVGLVRWTPASSDVDFQVKLLRYFYDNAEGTNSFRSAMQLNANVGTGDGVVVPVSTGGMLSVVEIANPSGDGQDADVVVHKASGEVAYTGTVHLNARGSYHFIVNPILQGGDGAVFVQARSRGGAMVTVMHYGFDPKGSLKYSFTFEGARAHGSSLRGTYNTYLGQDCDMFLANSTNHAVNVSISAVRSDGTPVIQGDSVTVPADGLVNYPLCHAESQPNYGVVTVQPSHPDSISAIIVRKGSNDSYRFATLVKE
ncbi:MAG: hypothetical protein U0136_13665 [Bdellovibrionota bacterium]